MRNAGPAHWTTPILRTIRRALWLGIILVAPLSLAVSATAQDPATTSLPPKPAYVQRGDEVEARYQDYRERLERLYQRFGARLEPEAPDLLAKLREAPPAPVPYGHGILPKLVPNPPRSSGAPIVSVSYSWRRTEGFINRDLGRVEKLEARLREADRTSGPDRRREWEKMVDEYRSLVADQKLTASHIDHNRLWQREIAQNPRGYNRWTALHDAVIERQAIQHALQYCDQLLEPSLRAREETLSRQIHEATNKTSPPDFLQFEHPAPHRWTVTVVVYTDIEDRIFVERFQSAVENMWRLEDGSDDFRVVVDMRRVPMNQLYPDGDVPIQGEHIDLAAHIDRFPMDGAVLTTGAMTVHVLGRSINVGPHDIAPNVLAHEFGHILGFPDAYFRGYRDRGPEGYEVVEVVIDMDDIMSAPGHGRVGRQHLQRLLAAAGQFEGADSPGRAAGIQTNGESEATIMKAGLHLLYRDGDPTAAAAKFQAVLERNPSHYGATFQLATALDRASRPAEALPLWENVLQMAEGYGDAATANTARTRLGRP